MSTTKRVTQKVRAAALVNRLENALGDWYTVKGQNGRNVGRRILDARRALIRAITREQPKRRGRSPKARS
jgi:hypothetical protein